MGFQMLELWKHFAKYLLILLIQILQVIDSLVDFIKIILVMTMRVMLQSLRIDQSVLFHLQSEGT
jgi:hypothetical protein